MRRILFVLTWVLPALAYGQQSFQLDGNIVEGGLSLSGGTVTGDIVFSGACASYQDAGTNDGFVCCADGCYGLQRGADEDPTNIVISSEDAWSQAAVNVTGGDLILAAGIGRRFITVSDYTLGTGDTVTLTVNGSATTLTEGADWDCIPTSNNACASALSTAIDTAAVGIDATASSATVYLDKIAGQYVRTFTITIADGGVDGAFGTSTSGDDGSIVIEHNLTNVNAIQFNTSPTHTHSEGAIHWDATDKTLHVDTEVTGTALQVGQEVWVRATNKTGVQIDNGDVVYINGAQGSRPTIALGDADTVATATHTIGMATQDIANNGTGYVTTFGLVRGLDTSGTPVGEVWAAGDDLYLSSTAGALTKTRPAVPAHSVRVGYVVFADASDGIILVKPEQNVGTYHAIDSTDADTMTISHDGTDGVITSQVGNVNIVSAGGAISMSDDNVTNVGDIDVDSITPDGASLTLGGAASLTSAAADPADAGVLRLGNTESIAWEAAPAGTDVTISVDTSEQIVASNTISIASGGNLRVENGIIQLTNSSRPGFNIQRGAATKQSTVQTGTDGSLFLISNWDIVTNADVDVTKPAWYMSLDAYTADNVVIARAPAAGAFTTVFTIDNAGELTMKGGFDAGDANIVNVGDIDVDSITPDGASLTIDDAASITSAAANPATAGVLRLGNTEGIGWRNAANGADITLAVDASDIFAFNSGAAIDGAVTINDGSADVDVRIESNNNANMLFVDGGEDRVGIGTGTPSATLDVVGSIEVDHGSKGAVTTQTGANEDLTCTNDASLTTSGLIPDGAFLVGVTTRVTTALTGPTDIDVGDGSTVNLYADASTVTQGSTTDNSTATATWSNPQIAAGEVTVTFNGGNCTAGVIRVVAHYFTVTAPTSN